MTENERIEAFLAGPSFAVVGASRDRAKYGNKVLRVYMQNGLEVVPVNPRGGTIEGLAVSQDLKSLPGPVHGISIITSPAVTEGIVEQAAGLGIEHVWMQPGAESAAALSAAKSAGMNVIAGGACILVVLGFREV